MPKSSGSSSSNPSSSGKDPLVSLARYSEIGFIIPSAVLLGFFVGKLLDYWLHTKWLYLVGLLFGAVIGFSQMIRMALSASGTTADGNSASGSNPDATASSSKPPSRDEK